MSAGPSAIGKKGALSTVDILKKERLEQAGIDVDDVLERFMGNEALLDRMLKGFLQDQNYSVLCQAMEAGDASAALTASHTLKGLCGNFSMKEMSELVTKQVALLRGGDFAGAAALMEPISKCYDGLTEAIRGCLA